MNKFLLIAIALLTLSCHRQLAPSTSTVVKDSTHVEVTTTLKDSTVSIPGNEVGLATTIEALLAEIERLRQDKGSFSVPDSIWRGIDSAKKTFVATDSNRTATASKGVLFSSATSRNLSALLYVDRFGNILFNCHEDSLKQRITWLEKQLTTVRDKSTVTIKEIPVKVPQKYIPTVCWIVMIISVGLNFYFIRSKIRSLVGYYTKPWNGKNI